MSTARQRFTVTTDWGGSHLTAEAVVAYVDDELAHRPQARATSHVATCADCAKEVAAQRQARSALRGADCPSMPSSLMSRLSSIPMEAELPEQPAGLAVGPAGEVVSVLRPDAFRTATTAAAAEDGRAHPDSRQHTRRRLRLGAGAAVSGLALGAIAFGVAAPADSVPRTTPGVDRGVLGGPVLNAGIPDARARFDRFETAVRTTPAPDPDDEPTP